MTTATEYRLKTLETRHLNRLLNPRTDERCETESVTRQDVLDELHDRALYAYAASSQGIDDLVVALGHALSGRLAGFTGTKLIRALGVLADQADTQDWAELASFGLNRRIVLNSLHELALRETDVLLTRGTERALGRLADTGSAELIAHFGWTRQQVLDELHRRALVTHLAGEKG